MAGSPRLLGRATARRALRRTAGADRPGCVRRTWSRQGPATRRRLLPRREPPESIQGRRPTPRACRSERPLRFPRGVMAETNSSSGVRRRGSASLYAWDADALVRPDKNMGIKDEHPSAPPRRVGTARRRSRGSRPCRAPCLGRVVCRNPEPGARGPFRAS